MAINEVEAVEAVEEFGGLLNEMLHTAATIKQMAAIEPPLVKSDLADYLPRLQTINGFPKSQESKKSVQYAVIETAVRDVFNQMLVRTHQKPRGRTHLTSPSLPQISISRLSHNCGIYLISSQSCRTMSNVIRPFCSGSLKNCWIVK